MAAAGEKNSPSRSEPLEGLKSPFLDSELFTGRPAEDWQPHVGALEAESAFQSAFEQPWAQPSVRETESAEGFGDKFVSPDEFEFEDAGIINGDNRVRVKDTTGVPWRWICKIDVADSRGRPAGSGTGVLISNKHVLTAAHVVYEAYKNMQQYTITAIPALNDLDEPFDRYSLASKPKIRQEYNPTAADHLDWDYALLTLSTSVGEKKFKALNDKPLCYWASPQCGANTVFARLDPRTLNGQATYTAGYPGGKGGKQLWCAAGILHSANEKRRTMSTTADTTKGQSGSPVWIIDNKRHCLVGMAVGAGTGTASNRLVRVTRELIRQLRAWITEGGETPAMVETKEALEPPVFLLPERETEPLPRSEAEDYEPPASEWSPDRSGEQTEDFSGVDYEEVESEALDEQRLEERFDPAAVPKDVADALRKPDWALALKLAIKAGWRDENDLTNLIFFARHPELPAVPLKPADPNFKRLSAEWAKILDKEVWNAIQVSSENTDLVVSGEEVTDHHRSFFRGQSGKRLKKLVEDAAREVDLNPGLLGAIMMAETRRPLSYFSSEKVSSYHIGCDDFFEGRAAIKARVPAFVKVKWDTKQTPAEHLNDAKTNPRQVKTILFDSGPDAVLATAVYLKFREVRLREIAAESGKDFDSLPLPTRFALTRMAMAAGTAGATPFLKDALNGVDVFVREAIPVRAFQTKRNATVRTAQAMHLSDWVFGIPVEPATRPAAHEAEAWEEQEDLYDPNSSLEAEISQDLEDIAFEDARTEGELEQDANPVIVQHDSPGTSTRLAVIGERIDLDLKDTAFAEDAEAIRWTIPGKTVRGYDGNVHNGELLKLTDADLQQSKITFYWIDAGDGRIVRARFRMKAGGVGQVVYVYDVKGPTVNSFTAKTGVTRIEKRAGLTAMRFGKRIEAPGVKWNWKVTMPPQHAGYIKDVQTVLGDRFQILRLKPGGKETRKLVWRHPLKTDPHVQLDGHSDNQPAYTAGLYEPKIEGGQTSATGDRGIEDSPHSELPPLGKTVSVNDQFTYYIMFKPAPAKIMFKPTPAKVWAAIWVPIARAKWFWKATANKQGENWDVSAAKMKPSIDMTAVEFPEYQTNAFDNEWQEISPPASKEQYAGHDDEAGIQHDAGEVEQTDESDEFADQLFESDEYPEPLMEELVPKVSAADLRKRIDEYFEFAKAEYTFPNGDKVKVRSQFHIASVGNPEQDAEKIEKLFEKKFGATFSRPLHTPIRCAAYGRARPDEIQVITQHLIDAGELDAVRHDNPGSSDEQLVRALQLKFNIGIDCAGYVQLAFIYAYTGKHDDARCNLVSLKLREDLGLKAKRSDENLASLLAKDFKEVGFLNGQTGDLLVLAWRKGERDWHTVIVVDHTVAGDIHTFLVDASWGFLYGPDAAGIARRQFVHDKSTGKWWDIHPIHPINGTKVNENPIGPYKGHPIKGMYRAKEK